MTKNGGLSCENRPQRCLSDRANLEGPSKISTFCLEELRNGVLLSRFRFSNCTRGVYKTYEASCRGSKTERDSVNYIFRRYINNGRILQSSTSACCINLEPPRGLGFIVNYQKSQLVPCQELEFLGVLINSNTLSLQLPGDPQKMSTALRSNNNNLNSRIVQIPGPPNLLHSGNISCSPSLQTSSESEKFILARLRTYEAELTSNLYSERKFFGEEIVSMHGMAGLCFRAQSIL